MVLGTATSVGMGAVAGYAAADATIIAALPYVAGAHRRSRCCRGIGLELDLRRTCLGPVKKSSTRPRRFLVFLSCCALVNCELRENASGHGPRRRVEDQLQVGLSASRQKPSRAKVTWIMSGRVMSWLQLLRTGDLKKGEPYSETVQ